MQVIVDGLKVNYQDVGQGSALVLLHGWGSDLNSFKALSDSLKHKYRVISLDLPGFGATDTPKQIWGNLQYTQFIKRFIEKLAISEYSLIGHSMSGRFIILGCAETIFTPEKIVLLGSAGVQKKSKQPKIISAVAKFTPKKARNLAASIAGSDDYKATSGIMREIFKQLIQDDMVTISHKVDTPSLLIYGRDDVDTPVLDGELLASQLHNAKLEIIEDAGHYVHLDAQDQVIKLIEDFI